MISELAMSWNVGGSNDKRHPSQLSRAERDANTARLKGVIDEAGVSRATLLDTKAQGDGLVTDQMNGRRIAEQFGFKNAGYVRLNDERLKRIGRGSGEIIFLTQHEKTSSQPIDLGNRQALSTIIDIGKYGLHVVSAYLDDAHEDTRLSQMDALLSYVNGIDVPTEINIDTNSLRPDMSGARLRDKIKDALGVRAAASTLPLVSYIPDRPGIIHELHWMAQVLPEMNRREVMPKSEAAGFTDADPRKRPTAPAKFPLYGVDYVLSDGRVAIDDFELFDPKGGSDHLALKYRATYE